MLDNNITYYIVWYYQEVTANGQAQLSANEIYNKLMFIVILKMHGAKKVHNWN